MKIRIGSRFFAIIIFLTIFAPMVFLLSIRSTLWLFPDYIDIAFGLIHVTFSLILILSTLKRNHELDRGLPWRLINYIFFITLPLISVLINENSINDIYRLILLILYSFNLLILFPRIAFTLDQYFFKYLTNLYLIFSIFLIVLTSYLFITDQNPYTRIGYPLNSGVFAYYMLIAFCISLFIKRRLFLIIFFAAFIIASGSRLSLILLILILFFLSDFKAAHKVYMVILLILFISVLIFLFNSDLLSPYVNEREDISSGRFYIWKKSLGRLNNLRAILLGYGSEQMISGGRILENKEYGTHNAFLNLALQYGIPFSFLSYILWFINFFPRDLSNVNEYKFRLSLFISITSLSLFYNIFWLNMGDGATFISLIFLLCDRSPN